jgi:hypothetical protein
MDSDENTRAIGIAALALCVRLLEKLDQNDVITHKDVLDILANGQSQIDDLHGSDPAAAMARILLNSLSRALDASQRQTRPKQG